MNTNPRYFYIRNKNKFPVACVAMTLDRESNLIHYGLSTHAPGDNFNRKFARELAKVRMEKHNKTVAITQQEETKSFRGVLRSLLLHLMDEKELPTRTRKAIKLWFNSPKSL